MSFFKAPVTASCMSITLSSAMTGIFFKPTGPAKPTTVPVASSTSASLARIASEALREDFNLASFTSKSPLMQTAIKTVLSSFFAVFLPFSALPNISEFSMR